MSLGQPRGSEELVFALDFDAQEVRLGMLLPGGNQKQPLAFPFGDDALIDFQDGSENFVLTRFAFRIEQMLHLNRGLAVRAPV